MSGIIPRAGMLATVRNRSGVVAGVEPFDGDTGRLHLVHVEYKDSRSPVEERLLWELEPHCEVLEPTALPDAGSTDAMASGDFDALVRAAGWTALSPYLDPGGQGPPRHEPIASPFHGAVRPGDYQLVPLLKALRMPRVNLLIADDVGLGKTIEAGLILTELLIRRRIRRVLVLAPAALRWQWKDELWEKFSLRFEHRLFLSATPHNGHTRSFTGLLEMLDPVRFTRTSEMNPAMRARVQDIVIRRLKREINAGDSAPRFCSRRPPQALTLEFEPWRGSAVGGIRLLPQGSAASRRR